MSQQLQQLPIYALTAVTKFEKVAEFKGRKGNFIKGFLLNDLRNKNGWRTTWESIKRHYEDFINKPGTYFERAKDMPDHPDGETYKRMMSNQENYRVTNIVGLELDHKSHTLNYIAEVLDESLTEIDFDTLLESGKINFTSPGVWPTNAEVLGHMPNGRPILDVHDWKALHYSYINDPAFGEEAAKTLGTCEGLGSECMTRLAASTNLEGNESLAPLQEVPLIRDKLNKIYTPCELKAFHAQLIAAGTDEAGQWITSNGQHIFIPEGQDKEEVVKKHFNNLERKDKQVEYEKLKQRQELQKKDKQQIQDVSDLESWSDNDKIKIKVGEVPAGFGRQYLATREIWNELPEEDKKFIKKLNVGKPPSRSKNAAGTFNMKTGELGIHPENMAVDLEKSDAQIKEHIKGVMTHEIAHSKFDNHPSQQLKMNWSNAVMKSEPITDYLKKFRKNVIKEKGEHEHQRLLKSTITKEISDLKQRTDLSPNQIQNLTKIKENRYEIARQNVDATWFNYQLAIKTYGNETHSEYAVLNKGQNTLWKSDMAAFEKIKPIYKQFFGSAA